MTAKPKPKPKVAPTYKNDKDYIKKQINLLVKLTNKPGVNGQKEREIWSQIDNLRNALGTLNVPKRKSKERGNGYMTLPSGKKITVVKGVMMNDNEARAALNPGGPGAAMPKKPEPKTPKPKEPWTVKGPDGNWRVTPSGRDELDRAGIRQTRRSTPRGGNARGR
jgi:hypothetical protein